MTGETEYTFNTKTGTCTVSPTRLVLTRQGEVGQAARFMYGKSVRRGLAIYSVLGAVTLVYGVWQLINQSYLVGALFCLIGAYLFWNVIASWNNSSINLIERSAVQSVEVQPPKARLSSGYFIIHFVHNGKKRKRLVMLPGAAYGGAEEYPGALAAMKAAGWL
jgi:hypothetical protein